MKNVVSSPSEIALKRFGAGYNCSQSVLLTMAEHWNYKNKLLAKVASTFGGGMGYGSVCGAVTGSLMAIGLKCGVSEPDESKEKSIRVYKLAGTFCRQFESQNGSIICRELIGIDLSQMKQIKKALEEHRFEKCPDFVKSAVEILTTLEDHTHLSENPTN